MYKNKAGEIFDFARFIFCLKVKFSLKTNNLKYSSDSI